MKRIISMTALMLLLLFCFTGCGNKNSENNSGSVNSGTDNNSGSGIMEDNSTLSDIVSEMMSYSATDIINTVKAAYGTNYYPDTAMLEDRLNEEFPIDKSLIKEIKAEMPTIGNTPDRIVAVVANEGKGSEVEAALNSAKTALLSKTTETADDYAKISASRVVRNGDYVCYIMLGENKNIDGVSNSVKLDTARAEILKGVSAFESMFKNS